MKKKITSKKECMNDCSIFEHFFKLYQIYVRRTMYIYYSIVAFNIIHIKYYMLTLIFDKLFYNIMTSLFFFNTIN